MIKIKEKAKVKVNRMKRLIFWENPEKKKE